MVSELYGQIGSGFIGGISGVFIALGVMTAIFAVIALYVYFSLAWMTIARKLKYKRAWLAWIPIANLAMIFQLGGFHWAWIFLILIPFLGWLALVILSIVATWKIFEKRKYPGWFSLSMIIPQIGSVLYLIAVGFVAWKDRKKKLF